MEQLLIILWDLTRDLYLMKQLVQVSVMDETAFKVNSDTTMPGKFMPVWPDIHVQNVPKHISNAQLSLDMHLVDQVDL